MNGIRILKAGMLTTIQDLGRYGYRSQGIPLSGAMDQSSAILANTLVGNNENDPVLECTYIGPEIEFLSDTYIAITGANVSISVDQIPQQINNTIAIKANSILSFGRLNLGCRFYIAFASGLKVDRVLGSVATDTISEIGPDIIQKEQLLELNQASNALSLVKLNTNQSTLSKKKIKVYRGPEYNILKDFDLNNKTFSVDPSSNRMAYILQSSAKPQHNYEMISSGVIPGTVQLTPSGMFIVLMRDAQTTGGYPRVLQLDEQSIDLLAQRIGGEQIQFKLLEF